MQRSKHGNMQRLREHNCSQTYLKLSKHDVHTRSVHVRKAATAPRTLFHLSYLIYVHMCMYMCVMCARRERHTHQLAGQAPVDASAATAQLGPALLWGHLKRRTTAVMSSAQSSSTSIQRSWALATTCMQAVMKHFLRSDTQRLLPAYAILSQCSGRCGSWGHGPCIHAKQRALLQRRRQRGRRRFQH